ncbi:Gag-Pol polyprotein [Gossypium australe]|uniref:Gag-Pol polyprotein n=1 Tax=Gossypium australe TaxID=47621 RepID=A0A5B6WHT9_9ROSI|nr:Gag-Pol polyprotein [Gossypium australe]
MDPNRVIANEVESNALALAQGIAPFNSRPVTANPQTWVEEFRANVDDDPERAEFWLENMIRVFDELSCTPAECLKCAISLLNDTWWRQRESHLGVLLDRVPKEIDKPAVSGSKTQRVSRTETGSYDRNRLSKYAREYVSTKEIMCKQFVDGLNEDIKLLVGILDLKEFVVLVDWACKAEDFNREKRNVDSEARDSRKRLMSSPYHSSSKKSRDHFNQSTTSAGYSNRDRGRQYTSSKAQATSVSSVGNIKDIKPECQQCGRRHFGDCWVKNNDRVCYSCGSLDHFIRDCPKLNEKDKSQNARSSNTTTRGRLPKNAGNASSNRGTMRDSTVRSEARVPAKAYAIRTREDASSPDVITSAFSLYETNVIALINTGSAHSYICMNLVSNNSFPVEYIEFVIKVSNPLGKFVLVDKNAEILHIESNESNEMLVVILSIAAQSYMRKGCEAYLAYVLDTKVSEKRIESVPIVCEYPDVFQEELLGLPPVREVEFAIQIVLGTSPISLTPVTYVQHWNRIRGITELN